MASDVTQKTQVALDMGGNIDIDIPLGEGQPDAMTARRPEIRLSIHEDLAAVESEWCSFEQGADCTVFQSFGWLSTWQLHIGRRKGVRPAIVTGRDSRGEIQFLLPLSVEPRGFARRLKWLGSENSDYNAPMLSPDFSQKFGLRGFLSLWPEILELIQGHGDLHFDLVYFEKMPGLVGTQQNPFRHLSSVTTHPSGAYLTHLAGDWENFYAAKRSTATRRRDRRKRKHLSEMGEVKFVTPKATEEIASSFDTLIAQKKRRFAAMGVGNIFDRPGYLDFYRSIALEPETRHITHVSRLDVGEAKAAISLGLTFRNAYYLVMSGYADGEIMRLSPGEAHLHELMRHAIGAGYKVFDFTIGDEPYKRDWSDTESELFNYLAAVRWRGIFAAGAFAALQMLGLMRIRRFIKQTPALKTAFSKARAMLGSLKATKLRRQ